MFSWAKSVNVPTYADQAVDIPTLKNTINVAANNECDDVVLFIAGHGTPPPGWINPETKQPEPGGPPSLSLNLSAARTGLVPNKLLTPADLRALIDEYPTIDFKVEIESCFAGRWAETLTAPDPMTGSEGPPNMVDLGLSSAADQTSKGQITLTKFDPTGRVIATGVAATDNPFHSGEFANGISHGLQVWATTQAEINATDGDLAAGVDDAGSLGRSFNAATSLGADVLPKSEHADPIFFHHPHDFRVKLAANEINGGFSVSGWTHGRFDTVQVDAPAGDAIVSFDAHGHVCVGIDDQGNVIMFSPNGITLPAGRRLVSIRCDRKPVDDDIYIAITLADGSAHGATVHATIKGGSQPYSQDLPVRQ
jgi:hypothetical protein